MEDRKSRGNRELVIQRDSERECKYIRRLSQAVISSNPD